MFETTESYDAQKTLDALVCLHELRGMRLRAREQVVLDEGWVSEFAAWELENGGILSLVLNEPVEGSLGSVTYAWGPPPTDEEWDALERWEHEAAAKASSGK